MNIKIFWIIALVTIFFAVFYIASFVFGGNEITLEKNDFKQDKTIDIRSGLNSIELAEVLAYELNWSEEEQNNFYSIYTQMKWDAFKGEFLEIFQEDFGWGELESKSFLTQSAKYFDPNFNFFTDLYIPGAYFITTQETAPEISDIFITRIRGENNNDSYQFIREKINKVNAEKVFKLVRKDVELLPDLAPLPAQDISIKRDGDNLKLAFSTIYYNGGAGSLELVADQETVGIREDVERDVLQRIMRKDGSEYTKIVGSFLWHQEHLHYHFADFVDYVLERVDENPSSEPEIKTKSTFCIRDVSVVNLELENRAEEAEYLICGKEKQGISVGWADTYFFSYIDQNLDVSNLSSGVYKLTFDVNPQRIINELDYENNKASALIDINIEELTVEIIGEEPENYPTVEHIYNEQVFD